MWESKPLIGSPHLAKIGGPWKVRAACTVRFMDLNKFNLIKLAYGNSTVEPILAAAPAASKMLLVQKAERNN